ncbi:MAG: hypothetical protein SGPRY_003926, partial [Prymnesium sp.]
SSQEGQGRQMIASADGEAPAVYFSRLVSNGALLQLLACLALASARSDPYVVGPIIALYAARESDRRALFLYLVVTAIAGLFELMFLLQGHPSDVWESLEVAFRLLLKVAMLYPSLKLHDLLPATRPPRVQPDQLKEQMAVVVQQASLISSQLLPTDVSVECGQKQILNKEERLFNLLTRASKAEKISP